MQFSIEIYWLRKSKGLQKFPQIMQTSENYHLPAEELLKNNWEKKILIFWYISFMEGKSAFICHKTQFHSNHRCHVYSKVQKNWRNHKEIQRAKDLRRISTSLVCEYFKNSLKWDLGIYKHTLSGNETLTVWFCPVCRVSHHSHSQKLVHLSH